MDPFGSSWKVQSLDPYSFRTRTELICFASSRLRSHYGQKGQETSVQKHSSNEGKSVFYAFVLVFQTCKITNLKCSYLTKKMSCLLLVLLLFESINHVFVIILVQAFLEDYAKTEGFYADSRQIVSKLKGIGGFPLDFQTNSRYC